MKPYGGIKPTRTFEVFGPFRVPTIKGRSARRIDRDCRTFWEREDVLELRRRIGCYVFAIRAAKGYRPVYVGKTWNSFDKEVFGSHQLYYYNAELADILKGNPVLFFVAYPEGRGRVNKQMIRDVEEFLIQIAVTRNSNLRNIIGKKEKKWGIRGVIRSGKGRTGETITEFKKTLRLP